MHMVYGLYCIHSQCDLVQCWIEHLIFKAVPLKIFVYSHNTHRWHRYCPWGQESNLYLTATAMNERKKQLSLNTLYLLVTLFTFNTRTQNATIYKIVTHKIETNQNTNTSIHCAPFAQSSTTKYPRRIRKSYD